MKTIVILIGLLVAYVTAEHPGRKWKPLCPLTRAAIRSTAECKETMKPSAETLEALSKGQSHGNKDVQCFYACVMEKAGIKNRATVDVDQMESLMRSRLIEIEENIVMVVDVLKGCKAEAEVSDDECEVMGNFHDCWSTRVAAAYAS